MIHDIVAMCCPQAAARATDGEEALAWPPKLDAKPAIEAKTPPAIVNPPVISSAYTNTLYAELFTPNPRF